MTGKQHSYHATVECTGKATMAEDPNGAGRFVSAVPCPKNTIRAGGDIAIADRLHTMTRTDSASSPVR